VIYHAGARALQDRFDSRRLADRIAERLVRPALSDDDRAFVERQVMFFLATVDAEGRPDCSYKGGAPGFVRALDARALAFPAYDGNGMFLSLGNLSVAPPVALLFIDFETPRRLRVHGRASIADDEALLAGFDGAIAVVRVAVDLVFPNCPRYIHPMQRQDLSPHAPRPGHSCPDAAWKSFEMFRDVLPRRP
jgi:predicted pyridoxine 5'-phosphate oxidase superfamily flavin-nucleotide-binding protein